MFGPGVRPIPITTLVEDAVHRNSLHSYFIQLADVNAYFLYQRFQPCGYVRRKAGGTILIVFGRSCAQLPVGRTQTES